MTLRTAFAATLMLCTALALPGNVGAASLSPLGELTGSSVMVPGLDDVPGLPDAAASRPILSAPPLADQAPFKFVDDTGLNANPLRGVLPEDQWANPQAVQNGLIQRR